MNITAKIDAVTEIPPAYHSDTPPAPRSVKIELTARCNFNCSYCARGDMLRQQGDMDRDLYGKLIRDIHGAGVRELGLFYLGESFMLPWLASAIAEAKATGFEYLFLTTNGSLATPGKIEACMVAGLDSLKFSLNYADADQFTDVAGVKPGLFAKVIRNVKDAYATRKLGGYKCGLYASYIQYDGEQGERMAELIAEVSPYLDEVYALPLYNQADLVTEQELAAGWVPTAGNRGRLDAMREPLPCWAVFTEGHVTYDGKLAACCFAHTDAFDMGDLTKTSFMTAWHSDEFQALRRAHLAKDVTGTPCDGCVVAS